MANRTVVIKGKNVGLDINRIAIYRNSINPDNLVSIVTKAAFMSGYEFEDDDSQDQYVCQCDDPCKTVVNLFLREKNYPPTVNITGATSALVGSNITLTATATDPNGDAVTYEWNDGTTNSTNSVTSGSAGDVNYSVVATDVVGDWGNDSHTVNWYTTTTTTTTTTAAPGTTTTTTTQPPAGSYDCNTISWATASYDCNTGAISVTPNYGSTTIHSYSPTTATQNTGVVQVTYTFSDSDPAWDNTGTQFTCTNALSVDTNCTNTTTTTTTTTTQAPATTTTTTTQAPATTTTTTQAPGYWNLRLCSTGSLANQQVQDTGNINTGDVFLAGNGICYEVDTFQSNQSGGLQIIVSEFGDCQECLDANGGV